MLLKLLIAADAGVFATSSYFFTCLTHRSASRGPPARVPYVKTVHRTVLSTLLRFASQSIPRLRSRLGDSVPKTPATLLKKG